MPENSFNKLVDQKWDNQVVNLLSQVHEHKAKQDFYLKERTTVLDRMEDFAAAQSAQYSNITDNVNISQTKYNQLANGKLQPNKQEEKEILGYRNTYYTVTTNHFLIPLTSDYIMQLHRTLNQYLDNKDAGKFVALDNPYEIDMLCSTYDQYLKESSTDPLILLCAFVYCFLKKQPFTDDNLQMSVLLFLLTLYKQGYFIGKYISIEKALYDSKEQYSEQLTEMLKSSRIKKKEFNSFLKYILSVILNCYQEFEKRNGKQYYPGSKSTSYFIVKSFVRNQAGEFTKQDVLVGCPKLGSSSVEAALKDLVDEGTLTRTGASRATRYIQK